MAGHYFHFVRKVVQQLGEGEKGRLPMAAQLRYATVGAVIPANPPNPALPIIFFAGSRTPVGSNTGFTLGSPPATPTGPGVAYLTSYVPTLNDIVAVWQNGSEVVVLGKLNTVGSTPPSSTATPGGIGYITFSALASPPSSSGGFANPLTEFGSIIYGGTVVGGVATPLELLPSTPGLVLTTEGEGEAPEWLPIPTSPVPIPIMDFTFFMLGSGYIFTPSGLSYVPPGATVMNVICIGGQGGASNGGPGSYVSASFPVTGGAAVFVTEGTHGGGAAGGGGASDVRLGGLTLASRVIVAGGGGAGAGSAGGSGGGFTSAQAGDPTTGTVLGGGGATNTAGGVGGTATGFGAQGGTAGTLGYGGSGGDGEGGYPSGGGGDGYYGGGGGGAATSFTTGGGGGTDYVSGSAYDVVDIPGYKTGNGSVTITYS